ncbi:unnamed protein product [Sphagnum balticum]
MQAELGMSNTQSGLVMSAFMLGYFLASPLFGYLADRKNRIRIIMVGTGLWSLATTLSGFSRSVTQLFISRTAVGVGEASIVASSPSLLADWFSPRDLNKAMAILTATIPLGSALGFVLGGLIEHHYGWRTVFFVAGTPGLILILTFYFFVTEPKRGQFDKEVNLKPAPFRGDLAKLFKNKVYLYAVFGYTAFTFCVGGFASWAPKYLVSVRNIPLQTADTWFGALTVVTGFSGTLAGGWVASSLLKRHKNGAFWLIIGSTLLAIPLTFGAFYMTTQVGFFVVMGFAEFFLFVSQGPVNVIIVESVGPLLRGLASAVSFGATDPNAAAKAQQEANQRAAEQAASNQRAQEQAAAQQQAAAQKAASDKAAADKAAAQKAASDKAAAQQQAAAQKAASDKAAADKAAAQKAASDKAAADKATQDKANQAKNNPPKTGPTPSPTTGSQPPKTGTNPPVVSKPITGKPIVVTKPPPANKPSGPVNPGRPAVVAPAQLNSTPAQKQQAAQQAKQALQNPKAAAQQHAQQAVAVQQKAAVIQKANTKQVLVAQKADLTTVKALAKVTPQQQQAAAGETAAKKATNLTKLNALDAKRVAVAPPAKFQPLPQPRPGVTLGINPKVNVQPLAPPKKIAPSVVVGGQQLPSQFANKQVYAGYQAGEQRRTQFQQNIQTNVTVVKNITVIQNTYITNNRTILVNRGNDYARYYRGDGGFNYRNSYSHWWNRGFYGGYYYPVVAVDPDILVHRHFWAPTVFWLYANSYQPEYYAGYYGDYYYYRAPVVPFRYVGVYYPTTVLVDFATEMASYSYDRQWAYRTALANLTDQLSQSISNQLLASFQLSHNDIVLNHYQNIGGGVYEMEGFINHDWLNVPFKATINIDDPTDPNTNLVFVAVNPDPDQTPPDQTAQLDAINSLMNSNTPDSAYVAYTEPEPPAPPPAPSLACSTFKTDVSQLGSGSVLTFNGQPSPDLSFASTSSVSACSTGDIFDAECSANVSCNDGQQYAPITTCTSQSNDQNFVDQSRDADLAFSQAVSFCTAGDGTDPDQCGKTAAISCVDSNNNALAQYQCYARNKGANNMQDLQIFGTPSFDQTKATQNAKDACSTSVGVNAAKCSDDDLIFCQNTNGVGL